MKNNAQRGGFYAYCRESVNLDTGIEIQKEKIKKYSEIMNIPVVKWYIDNDASAFKSRPKYTKMMTELFDDMNVKGIICTDLTRFGRQVVQVLTDVNTMREKGKELILIDNNIDTSTVSGKAMLGMLAIFAQFERDTTKERVTAGRRRAQQVGTKSGLPLHRPKIQPDWKSFDKYYSLGLSISAISKLILDMRTGKRISRSALYAAMRERIKREKT